MDFRFEEEKHGAMNSTLTLAQDPYTFTPLILTDEPKYMTIYEWEKTFDLNGWRQWMSRHWTISVYAATVYVCFIFGMRRWMRDRKPFNLRPALIVWNLILAIFSILVTLRTLPEFLHVILGKNGFHNSVCHWQQHNHATAFWSWLFMASKLPELGDTVFVVLRKQRLIFLHWYHHATVLLSVWVVYELYEPYQQWTVVMNAFVHSFMYTYYLFKAMGVKVPRSCALVITSLQLLQMVVGIYINVYSLNILMNDQGLKCDRGYFGHQVPLLIYTTYSLLFAHFFYNSYLKPKSDNLESRFIKRAPKAKSDSLAIGGNENYIAVLASFLKSNPSEKTVNVFQSGQISQEQSVPDKKRD